MRELVLTPYVSFQGEPHLYNHEAAVANFPDHLLTTGVKATYRFTCGTGAGSVGGIDSDQHSPQGRGPACRRELPLLIARL